MGHDKSNFLFHTHSALMNFLKVKCLISYMRSGFILSEKCTLYRNKMPRKKNLFLESQHQFTYGFTGFQVPVSICHLIELISFNRRTL